MQSSSEVRHPCSAGSRGGLAARDLRAKRSGAFAGGWPFGAGGGVAGAALGDALGDPLGDGGVADLDLHGERVKMVYRVYTCIVTF